jgi:integrase
MSKRRIFDPDPADKPEKPHPDFPLFAHRVGLWAKKIKGKHYYFGHWNDPQGALDNYLKCKDAILAGVDGHPTPASLTLYDGSNHFLHAKKALVNAGELSPRSWKDYQEACKLLVKHMGKNTLVRELRPTDFGRLREKVSERWRPYRMVNVITRIRSVFKYLYDSDLIDRPVKFGPEFRVPSAKTLRLHKAAQGPKLFTAEELRHLITEADVQLRGMIFLAINAGYGVGDCGRLPLTALDLAGGWVNFARPKTGIARRCPLWPETVEALRAALAERKAPRDPALAALVFLTYQGRPWHQEDMSSPLVFKFKLLMKKAGIAERKGIGFYTIRHTHRTVSDETRDAPACDHIMGHLDMAAMSNHYRERISDERLQSVAEHVRRWLYGTSGVNTSTGG